MSISVTIPADLEPFVKAELANGTFSSEGELVAAALELYREMKSRHNELRANVERSRNQVARGEVAQLDMEEVIARGHKRLANDGIMD